MEIASTTYSTASFKPRYPGEVLLRLRQNPLALFQRMAATGADIVHLRIGPRRLVLLNHADFVREVLIDKHDAFRKGRALRLSKFLLGEGLLTSEDPVHRRQRKLVLPAFHHHRLRSYADTMVVYTRRLTDAWDDGQEVVFDEAMTRLTLQVAGKTLFNAEVGRESDEISRALTTTLQMFRRTSNPLAELLNRLPLPSTIRLNRARARLDATVYRMIESRRASGEDHGDLLSMLLAAQDEETGAGMTDQQVRDEVMTLFLAGHETTANALAWTGYLLAQHPEVEARLYDEVHTVLRGRPAGFDDLQRLPYTRQVFSEAMRLYPPAWIIGREATEDVTIGGQHLVRGTTVFVSQYLLHRDPRFWPDPERFDPDRFAPEQRAQRHKFAYFPFGTGRRGCIGEQFAWTEGILVLATLAQRWLLRLVSDEPVEVFPSITLRPRRPLRMRVEQIG